MAVLPLDSKIGSSELSRDLISPTLHGLQETKLGTMYSTVRFKNFRNRYFQKLRKFLAKSESFFQIPKVFDDSAKSWGLSPKVFTVSSDSFKGLILEPYFTSLQNIKVIGHVPKVAYPKWPIFVAKYQYFLLLRFKLFNIQSKNSESF